MRLTRKQVTDLHRALVDDPTIELVEMQATASGRVSFYRPETVVKLTRIRVTPGKTATLDAALSGRVKRVKTTA